MIEEISPDELHERLQRGEDVQVIDIRTGREFERGHIPGATNVPFPRLPREMDGVDWDDEIVVACPKGKSSKQAARLIQSYEGVDDDATVLNLEGGYDEWDHELDGEQPPL